MNILNGGIVKMDSENQFLDWLKNNKALRMDANNEIFDVSRRNFHLSRYQFAQAYCKDKIVLDAACGTGYGSDLLAVVAKHVTGIDCDAEAIEYAKHTYQGPDTDFQVSFVEATSFSDSQFDVVVSFETVEHTLCPKSHLREITRLLKPDGLAIVSVPNNWGLTDHHFWDFNFEMLDELLSSCFSEINYFYNNASTFNSALGIGKYDPAAPAECIIAVCDGVIKSQRLEDRYAYIMSEIYEGVFARHRESLTQKESHLNKKCSWLKRFL